MVRDTLERATEPNLNLKGYLQDSYVHPVFKSGELDKHQILDDEDDNPLVPTKRNSRMGSSKNASDIGSDVGLL